MNLLGFGESRFKKTELLNSGTSLSAISLTLLQEMGLNPKLHRQARLQGHTRHPCGVYVSGLA
jgi:hypothetical protein